LTQPTYPTVSVTCPNCHTRFAVPVVGLIDVGQNPGAKFLLLSGQINVAVCPRCGTGGRLAVPLVYHDPEKELFLTYIPAEMGLPETEQQRIIGEMTNTVISRLPPEQRKGYLLRPRNFFRLETMIEEILKADGITPEMLQAHQARLDLLNRLMQAADAEARRLIAQENDGLIDEEFFRLLQANVELSYEGGSEETRQRLLALRRELLEWTTVGREIAEQEEAIRDLGERIDRKGLLEKLIAAARDQAQARIKAMVAVGRPIIDYLFYQQLAEQIEAAEAAGDEEEASLLRSLRETILELTDKLDAEAREEIALREQLLQQIVASDDVEQAVMANLLNIDELFLYVLENSIQAAEQAGRQEQAKKLSQVGDVLMRVIRESQPFEVRLINQLLEADYPEGTQALLHEHRARLNEQVLELMGVIADDMLRKGQGDLAHKMLQIREQAQKML